MDSNGCNSIAGMARVLNDARRGIAGPVPGPLTGAIQAKRPGIAAPRPLRGQSSLDSPHGPVAKLDLTTRHLFAAFLGLPLVSLKVIGAIPFEAARLWLKGAPLQ